MKKLFILTFALTALVACGENEERADELQKTNTAAQRQTDEGPKEAPVVVPVQNVPVAPPPVFQTVMPQLFVINPTDDLSFIQGQSKRVYFSVVDIPGLVYDLKMVDGPTDLGAKFSKDSNGYYIQWTPGTNILTSAENSKKYTLAIHFDVKSGLSEEEMAGQVTVSKWDLKLLKNDSQPYIEDVVTYSHSGQTLNPGETGYVDFIVSAAGINKADDLNVNLYRGPEKPALELVQLDGTWGINERPLRVATLESKNGRNRYKYRVNFDADKMIEHILREIHKNPEMKRREGSGRINQAEASFSVQAINTYNKQASPEVQLFFKVNLSPKAAEAKLTGPESLSVNQGSAPSSLRFQILSVGGKGSVTASAEIPETAGVTVNFKCNPASQMANRNSCLSTNCRLECTLTADASCSAKSGTVTVPVKAVTKLYDDEKVTDFRIFVKVQPNSNYCSGGQP